MGDKDYRQTINAAFDAITKESTTYISNPNDNKTIFLYEVVRCMRRSYFDRLDRLEPQGRDFRDVFGGLIRKLPYGSAIGEFAIEDLKLKGQSDMIVDDIIIVFKIVSDFPEAPTASDILYLNSCMWIFNKMEGVIVYITSNGKETSFAINRDKKMFEETIRRVRVFSNLIGDKKIPILEPSTECSRCQYYERCYIKKHEGRQLSLTELFGVKKN